jgi:ArsR family transcriptional regulator, cadmium/lead-responsive transcriptional repressor
MAYGRVSASLQPALYPSVVAVLMLAYMTAELDLDALSRLGVALSDETRRCIVALLARRPAYPSELAMTLNTTRANVSNHLTCLRGCGIVTAQPEGRRMRYELVDPRFGEALRGLVATLGPSEPHHPHRPELTR